MLLASLLKADLYFLSKATGEEVQVGQCVRSIPSLPRLALDLNPQPAACSLPISMWSCPDSQCQEQDLTVDAPGVESKGVSEIRREGARDRPRTSWMGTDTFAGAGQWEGALEL